MEATFIKGTQGNLDYIVINEDDKVVVGIKPVFEITPANENNFAIAAGIRLRVIPNGDIINVGHVAKSMFPDYKFKKVETHRASAYNIALIPIIPPGMPYGVFYEAITTGGFVEKIDNSINYIFSELDNPKITKEELHKYVYDKFESNFNEINELLEETKPSNKNKGKVIPIKKKED